MARLDSGAAIASASNADSVGGARTGHLDNPRLLVRPVKKKKDAKFLQFFNVLVFVEKRNNVLSFLLSLCMKSD